MLELHTDFVGMLWVPSLHLTICHVMMSTKGIKKLHLKRWPPHALLAVLGLIYRSCGAPACLEHRSVLTGQAGWMDVVKSLSLS